MLKTGVQFYSVRDFSEKDFFGTLKKIKAMGYEGVEFAGLYGNTPAEIKKFLAEIALEPVSAHVSIDEMLSDPDKCFASYKEIGCRYIAIPYLGESRRPGGADYDRNIADFTFLAEKSKEYGLTMLYHNHNFEFEKVGDKYFLDLIYDSIPSSLLQTELDTCWVNVGGEDPAEYILKYANRSPVVHIKDFVMKNREAKSGLYELIGVKPTERQADEGDFAFRPAGYGVQNIPAILEAAEKAGSEWIIVEQDRPCLGWSSLECVEKAVNYLKEVNK